MHNSIKILDCTLRDGGRVINCAFPQFHIDGILLGLIGAGVDIIEMGFLRGNTKYEGNSTFFSEMEQARKCIPTGEHDTMFVLFADYGEEYSGWDFRKLPECDGKTVTGIRLGFRKENFEAAYEVMQYIQKLGYKLFAQMVETRNYTDLEFLSTLEKLNDLHPYAVAIVDTFGRMYKDDLVRYYTLADNNLDDEVIIDFHTHNNMQLSFALAQEMITMSRGKRQIIIDATLDGMGKAAGNLNLELILEYLNSQYGYNYKLDCILDTIDEHIYWIKKDHPWGYSLPSLMSALFSSHPNNVDYLLKKNRLRTKDIRYILSQVDVATRKVYDYDNLDRIYLEYSSSQIDDAQSLQELAGIFQGRVALVVVFGATSKTYRDQIIEFINQNHPIVISVNHVYAESSPHYIFYGNQKRYYNDIRTEGAHKRIITSNITSTDSNDIVVDYSKVISVGYPNYDNSTIMLLNLLHNVGVKDIAIAGFDGFSQNDLNTYSNEVFAHNSPHEKYDNDKNTVLKTLLKHFVDSLSKEHSVYFITPSIFKSLQKGSADGKY